MPNSTLAGTHTFVDTPECTVTIAGRKLPFVARWLLPCMALACALLAGCSNVEVPDLAADVEREQIIPKDWQPIPLRVGLAPFRSALEMDERRHNVEDTKRWVLTPDNDRLNGPEGLHRQLLETLRTYRMFERIDPIDGATPDTPREELESAALRQGLDLVIIPTVKRHDVGYVDSNGAYGWNMFVWWMVSPIFSWWIADEDFDAHLHVDLRLYPTTSDNELGSTRLQPPETIIRSLDDWDEGWNAFSIFSTPNHFDEENWVRIGKLLMPIAENEAKKSALRYATRDLKQLSQDEAFLAGIRRRVALVVGIDGTGTPPQPLSRFAVRDAQAFAAQFSDAINDGVPDGALRGIYGPQATRRGIEAAADDLARLARYNDDVLLVFCGVGTVDDRNRLAIVPAQPAGLPKLETLALEDLLDKLLVNKPRTLTLILDCSFVAPGDKRCALPTERARALAQGQSLFAAVLKRCADAGVKCLLFSATDATPGESAMPAMEIEDLGHGLFSSFMLQGLAGAADTNRDRQVSATELQRFVAERVERIANLEGSDQRAHTSIDPDRKDLNLPAWRR